MTFPQGLDGLLVLDGKDSPKSLLQRPFGFVACEDLSVFEGLESLLNARSDRGSFLGTEAECQPSGTKVPQPEYEVSLSVSADLNGRIGLDIYGVSIVGRIQRNRWPHAGTDLVETGNESFDLASREGAGDVD